MSAGGAGAQRGLSALSRGLSRVVRGELQGAAAALEFACLVLAAALDPEVDVDLGEVELGDHGPAAHLDAVLLFLEGEAALHAREDGAFLLGEGGGVAHVGEREQPDDLGAEGQEGSGDGHGDAVGADAVPDEESGDGEERGPPDRGDEVEAFDGDAEAAGFGGDDRGPDDVRAAWATVRPISPVPRRSTSDQVVQARDAPERITAGAMRGDRPLGKLIALPPAYGRRG